MPKHDTFDIPSPSKPALEAAVNGTEGQVRGWSEVLVDYQDQPDYPGRTIMEFRLGYYGALVRPTQQDRRRLWEKHRLRIHFHSQLELLWRTHPLLQYFTCDMHIEGGGLARNVVRHDQTQILEIAKRYRNFVPLVCAEYGQICELDILILRPEPAGGIWTRSDTGGDVDNRIKTLVDSLAIPNVNEPPPTPKEGDLPDPVPTFVLLTDDKLITSLKVTADRFLAPETDDPSESVVIVHVIVKSIDPTRAPYGMHG